MRGSVRVGWLALGTAWFALAATGAPASAADDEAVRDVVLDYAEGWATADEERMARALHPQALKRRVVIDVLSGEPRVQTINAVELRRATRAGAGKPLEPGPLNFRVSILDRHGDMAVARVVSPLYVHYLELVRWEGRWVVFGVLWGTVAAPGE
jgi:hypothetical protein